MAKKQFNVNYNQSLLETVDNVILKEIRMHLTDLTIKYLII